MSTPSHVDLVLFTVGGARYGADLAQVRRVDVDDPSESVGAPLGQPVGHRALVFMPAEGYERRLRVDTVHGVKRVPADSLRRLPRAAAAPPMTVGAWLDGQEAVLLIDLHALAAPLEGSRPHGH